MIIYKNCIENDLDRMCDLWNEVVNDEKIFQTFTYESYRDKFTTHSDFNFNEVFGAFENDILLGFGICLNRKTNNDDYYQNGYLNTVIVKKEYRNKGIGSQLLQNMEKYLKESGRAASIAAYYLPLCYEWYIPHTNKHNHPCAPAIRVNSQEYFFLLHNGYEAVTFCDAFHLDLIDYNISTEIQKILDECEKEGITIELYDKNKHYGLDEFYKDLNIYDFEKVIKENLALENPFPFLVVSDHGKICGWTGAMYNEDTGRGHFDGIAILDKVRGRGLGKALFSLLAYHSKLNGAKFMTFYTGLNNIARYIYIKAGFKIVQTFAIMKKKL